MNSKKKMNLFLLSLFSLSSLATITKDKGQYHTHDHKCLRDDNADVITVHLIPHSHDDVGWLKTVDQYYVGANNYIQDADVHEVISSYVKELIKDPAERFT